MTSRAKGIAWDSLPLGKLRDRDLAAQLGCTPQAVAYARKVRGIASPNRQIRLACDPSTFAEELGRDHDRVVAERHGLCWQQVARARRARGVPGARLNWDAIAPELGTAPDIVIARKYQVDNKVVAQARWRRGIPKWQESRTCPCGESFVAFHLRQKFCSYRCQRYHWDLIHKKGVLPEVADHLIALWAFKRTAKNLSTGRRNHVD